MKLLISASLLGFGLLVLRLIWARKEPFRLYRFMAWLTIWVSVCFFVENQGMEFGVLYWLFSFSLIALGFVLLNTEVKTNKGSKTYVHQAISIAKLKLLKHTLNTLVVLLVFSVLSVLLCVYAGPYFFHDTINQLAFIVLCFPLLWATLAYVYTAQRKKYWIGIASSVIASVLVYISFAA